MASVAGGWKVGMKALALGLVLALGVLTRGAAGCHQSCSFCVYGRPDTVVPFRQYNAWTDCCAVARAYGYYAWVFNQVSTRLAPSQHAEGEWLLVDPGVGRRCRMAECPHSPPAQDTYVCFFYTKEQAVGPFENYAQRFVSGLAGAWRGRLCGVLTPCVLPWNVSDPSALL